MRSCCSIFLGATDFRLADYPVERAGGVLERWQALQEKKHAGTMLMTPFDLMAKAAGLNVLDYAIDVYGHYQGVVGATRRAWATKNSKTLESYIRGYVAGLAFLYDATQQGRSHGYFAQEPAADVTGHLAAQCYIVMVSPKGFAPHRRARHRRRAQGAGTPQRVRAAAEKADRSGALLRPSPLSGCNALIHYAVRTRRVGNSRRTSQAAGLPAH